MSKPERIVSASRQDDTRPSTAWRTLLVHPVSVCLLLAAVTVIAFWPVTACDFINYDDPDYVTENRHVQAGLTCTSMAWAFTTTHASNWHPLTWLSHMLDVELFGKSPRGPHCVNLLIHAANASLLFLLLRRLTHAHWRSAMVAALFALHPLHVESVAWVAERKDVLSTLFWVLCLMAYVRYVEAATVGNARSQIFYWSLPVLFSLGLMCKPMLVTLPFVLLLLDYWPLGRMQNSAPDKRWVVIRNLLKEKVPLLVLSAASCLVTSLAQKQAMQSTDVLPFEARIANAFVAYARYLGKTFWPTDLALPYPHPGQWPEFQVLSAVIGITAIFAGVFLLRARFAFAVTGWLWFWGTLIPVIGLIQVGSQAMGDRYTYVPLVGIFLALVWGAAEIAGQGRWMKSAVVSGSLAGLAVCAALTRNQLGYWHDSERLFRHSVAVTENNCVALDNLGVALELRGDAAHAIEWYQRALQVDPTHTDTLFNMGNALAGRGQSLEAIPFLEGALRARPNNHRARNNLANVLAKLGRNNEAVNQYQLALQFEPSDPKIHKNIAVILISLGRLNEAIDHNRQALKLAPADPTTHYGLGLALALQGNWGEAIRHYTESLRLSPTNPEAQYNLGYAFRVQGKFEEATTHFNEALRLKPEFALAHFNLGATLAAQGFRDRAIVHLQEAIRLDPDYTEAKALLHSVTSTGLNGP